MSTQSQFDPVGTPQVLPPLTGTILVPVDLSSASRAALDVAHALARRLGAQLEVLHVWQPPPVLAPDVSVRTSAGQVLCLEDYAMHRAAADLEAFMAHLPTSEQARAVLRSGSAAETILRFAEDQKPSMIVMGTHGRRGLERLLMGSVTEQVLRRSSCPVLAVPCHGVAPEWPEETRP
jgi:nucleotide-binding universal stress UspA family protein